MTVPFEQLNSDSFFQQANLCAKRWLGQVKSFGRTPEIEFFGDGNKVPCVTEFHRGHANSYNLSLRSKQSNSAIRLSEIYCAYNSPASGRSRAPGCYAHRQTTAV